ncbi:nuclear transport factor 2 family protein [Hoeflea prorocentri]|uniref:Nuclear transport factor 2 family protein n=1 Tax=Hoeflea prorocentri TaxID=1922333 RepID=A0A9X3UJ51_9HYPH|nr:nuclear transport factor 2 family protein [Hoeflea prorocentri]MCY6382307.1 nuclear transport factor 2 family protein [Hoeflea prorocentri]MDA5400107.1 nuclear transport factor 2 family protein [Hoeflea prorocentri]
MNTLALAAAAALTMAASASPSLAADTKDIVTSAMTELMINKNVNAIDTYFAEPYIQHNQSVPTGLDALKGLAGQVIADNPAFKYSMVRILADGDVGIAHGVYEGFGEMPLVAFDVFRVENGKIVEHWDNLSPIAADNPSGRSQTDGPVEVTDLDKTDANKTLVREFVETVLIGGAFDRLPDYFDGNNYIQHNSNIADGLDGLQEGLQALAKAGVTMRIAKVHEVYGEGNFVLVMSEGDISGKPMAFYDLFRVEGGKIAEHWDVIAPILPAAEAANSNGKF